MFKPRDSEIDRLRWVNMNFNEGGRNIKLYGREGWEIRCVFQALYVYFMFPQSKSNKSFNNNIK